MGVLLTTFIVWPIIFMILEIKFCFLLFVYGIHIVMIMFLWLGFLEFGIDISSITDVMCMLPWRSFQSLVWDSSLCSVKLTSQGELFPIPYTQRCLDKREKYLTVRCCLLYSFGSEKSCRLITHPFRYLTDLLEPDFNANAYFFLATKKCAHLDICMNYFVS
jgi:hypothetical protein